MLHGLAQSLRISFQICLPRLLCRWHLWSKRWYLLLFWAHVCVCFDFWFYETSSCTEDSREHQEGHVHKTLSRQPEHTAFRSVSSLLLLTFGLHCFGATGGGEVRMWYEPWAHWMWFLTYSPLLKCTSVTNFYFHLLIDRWLASSSPDFSSLALAAGIFFLFVYFVGLLC